MNRTVATQEQTLRRLAKRQGFHLFKSRSRTPEHQDYGKYFIADSRLNVLLTYEHGMTLDEAEDWLLSQEKQAS